MALFNRLALTSGGTELLPVLWTDNYLSLAPGETRTVTARSRQLSLASALAVEISGSNVAATSLPVH